MLNVQSAHANRILRSDVVETHALPGEGAAGIVGEMGESQQRIAAVAPAVVEQAEISPSSIPRFERFTAYSGVGSVPKPQKNPLFSKDTGAVEKTRTSTAFRPQRPQRCASTSSATTAHRVGPRRPGRWQARASSKGCAGPQWLRRAMRNKPHARPPPAPIMLRAEDIGPHACRSVPMMRLVRGASGPAGYGSVRIAEPTRRTASPFGKMAVPPGKRTSCTD